MRSIDSKFYKSKEWKKCRDGYIKHVGGLCERCLARGLIVPGYIVHHKVHLTQWNYQDPSVSLNYDNLEYLCESCHNAEHFGTAPQKRYTYDENGQLVF